MFVERVLKVSIVLFVLLLASMLSFMLKYALENDDFTEQPQQIEKQDRAFVERKDKRDNITGVYQSAERVITIRKFTNASYVLIEEGKRPQIYSYDGAGIYRLTELNGYTNGHDFDLYAVLSSDLTELYFYREVFLSKEDAAAVFTKLPYKSMSSNQKSMLFAGRLPGEPYGYTNEAQAKAGFADYDMAGAWGETGWQGFYKILGFKRSDASVYMKLEPKDDGYYLYGFYVRTPLSYDTNLSYYRGRVAWRGYETELIPADCGYEIYVKFLDSEDRINSVYLRRVSENSIDAEVKGEVEGWR